MQKRQTDVVFNLWIRGAAFQRLFVGRDGIVNTSFSQQIISQQVICLWIVRPLLYCFLIVSDGLVYSAILIEGDSQVVVCSEITNLDR